MQNIDNKIDYVQKSKPTDILWDFLRNISNNQRIPDQLKSRAKIHNYYHFSSKPHHRKKARLVLD